MKKSKQKNRRLKSYFRKQIKKKPPENKEISIIEIEKLLKDLSSTDLIRLQNHIMYFRYKKALESGIDIGYTPLMTHF